jgi:hypothetical protein
LQADGRAARSKTFQAFLDDQKRWHRSLQAVKGYIFADPKKFSSLVKEFNSLSFKDQLKKIEKDP